MAKYGATGEVRFGSRGEACLDAAVPTSEQRAVSLEQKVTELYELLRAPVCRYLIGVLGHPGEAEELTQETFLKLYLHLHGGQTVNDVRAWVFRVAHNLAADERKGFSKRHAWLEHDSWDEVCRQLRDTRPDPEQRLLEAEKFERLHVAVGRLSPQQRQCLLLRSEGFRYREIADILGIDISTVAEFVRRAIKKLVG